MPGARPDTEGSIVVFGGRSEIGLEVAVRLASGKPVVLAARHADNLDAQRRQLLDAGATSVATIEFDADDTATHPDLITSIAHEHGPIGVAILAFGILGDQKRAERDAHHALQIVQTDYVGQVSVLTTLANCLREQASGAIIVFSSVAGVRVRRGNYVYGSTKAGLDGFSTGLSDALYGSGVHLLLARPGFVVGHMTADLMASGTRPAPLSRTAPQVADAVVSALHRGKHIVWIPGVLRPVFAVMRMVPQSLWRRLPR